MGFINILGLSVLMVFLTGISVCGAPSVVRIENDGQDHFTLIRDGRPYLVKGANWPTPETVDSLVNAGGNSVRTYGDEVEWMLPLAQKRGLTLLLGLEIGRERQGFDYNDKAAVDRQFERLRTTVRRYKKSPELLMWAIGNEPELLAKNTTALWIEVNRIARMIREEDPYHPVITVVAGFDEKKIRDLARFCPDLDALGVNWYGRADQWPENLRKFGWTKPYLHTEFGPLGYWQSKEWLGQTKWGAPIEQHSSEKAALYAENWQNAVVKRSGQSLGGYAFIWGPKQERTPTWFSMHLFSGERTPMVDAMQTAWKGQAPENPAPEILTWKPARISGEFQPGETIAIEMTWKCNRPVLVSVEIRTESEATQVGGDVEPATSTLKSQGKEVSGGVEISAPEPPGHYRVFVYLKTDDGSAATANLPIAVTSRSP